MIRSLAQVGRRQLSAHRGRSVFAAVSVALGVALVFGIVSANATMSIGMNRLEAVLTGSADVVVSPGTDGLRLAEDTEARVGARDGAARVESVYGTVTTAGDADTAIPVSVAGVQDPRTSLTGAAAHHGALPSGPDEVAVSPAAAAELDLDIGSTVSLLGTELIVSGILYEGALTGEGGQAVALVSRDALPPEAQQQPVRVLVQLDPDSDSRQWVQSNADVAEDALIEDAREHRVGLVEVFRGISSSLTAVGLVALLLALYLVRLAFATSVAQRTRDYATLRSMGSTPRQVRTVVLSEAAIIGVVGSIAGLLLGVGVAYGVTSVVESTLTLPMPTPAIPVLGLIASLVAGIAVSLVGALGPARRAGKVAPIESLSGTSLLVPATGRRVILTTGGLFVCFAVAIADPHGVGSIAVGAAFFVAAALLPWVLPQAMKLTLPIVRRFQPGIGEVAVQRMELERTRTPLVCALVMSALGVVLLVGATYTTMRPAFANFVEQQYGADLQLQAGSHATGMGTFDSDFVEDVANIPGVRDIAPLWHFNAHVDGSDTPQVVTAIDPSTYFDVSGFAFDQGSADDAASALARGAHILTPRADAHDTPIRTGDHMSVTGPKGTIEFEVAGTTMVMGDERARAVVISHDVAAQLFDLGDPPEVRIAIDDSTTAEEVGASIRSLEGGAATTLTFGRANIERQLERFDAVFAVFIVLLFMAVLVGLAGMINTMLMSVLDRTRELGILRALGAQARDLRAMVLLEALLVILVALGAAVVLTFPLSRSISLAVVEMFGFPATVRYPWSWIVPLCAGTVAAAGVGAMIPARRAATTSVVDSLRTN